MKRGVCFSGLVGLGCLVSACATGGAGAAPGGQDAAAALPQATTMAVVATPIDLAPWQRDMLQSVNRLRAGAGCAPLAFDQRLAVVAQAQANIMADRSELSHDLFPDDLGDRIERTGYRGSSYGENIAGGMVTGVEAFAEWAASPPHRANIESCDFKAVGFAYRFRADDRADPAGVVLKHYWVQVFGG